MATKKSDNLTKVTWYLVDDSVLGSVTQVCAYGAITPFKNKVLKYHGHYFSPLSKIGVGLQTDSASRLQEQTKLICR